MPIKTWEKTVLCWNICGGPGEQQAIFQTTTDWPTEHPVGAKKNLMTPK